MKEDALVNLAVVIPFRNRRWCMDQVLQSMVDQTLWAGGRVRPSFVLLDNGSTDGTAQRLLEWEKRLKSELSPKYVAIGHVNPTSPAWHRGDMNNPHPELGPYSMEAVGMMKNECLKVGFDQLGMDYCFLNDSDQIMGDRNLELLLGMSEMMDCPNCVPIIRTSSNKQVMNYCYYDEESGEFRRGGPLMKERYPFHPDIAKFIFKAEYAVGAHLVRRDLWESGARFGGCDSGPNKRGDDRDWAHTIRQKGVSTYVHPQCKTLHCMSRTDLWEYPSTSDELRRKYGPF